MNLLKHLEKFDWILSLSCIFLVLLGLASLFSSGIASQNFTLFYKQGLFLIIGIIAMLIISFYDYRKLRENSNLIIIFYLVSMILLLGILFFAPNIRGITSWYKLGPISFDPIEPAKIALILLLAKYFSKRHDEIYNFKHIINTGIYVAIPCILVFFQPDFGAVVIFLCIWFGMLLVAGIRKKHFLILILCFIIFFSASFFFLMEDYQKTRILSFTSQQEDSLGAGWNKNQAQIAIGSGGLIGKGIGSGTQTQLGFLPEPETDFIFSAIAEEMGMIGIGLIFIFYGFIFYRILKISINSRSNFARLFAAGWALSLFSQMFINISMNLGMLPVVGLPLPLVSYGGSNLLFNFVCLGIMESIRIVEA